VDKTFTLGGCFEIGKVNVMDQPDSIFWFRRDLRITDNAGFFHALKENQRVLCVFVFDTNILGDLKADDRRMPFIRQETVRLRGELQELGSDLLVGYGRPLAVIKEWHAEFGLRSVYANRDYEPYAKQRDKSVMEWAEKEGVRWSDYKDQVIFDRREVVKEDGGKYTVFTPYKRKWLSVLQSKGEGRASEFLRPYEAGPLLNRLWRGAVKKRVPELKSMGFESAEVDYPSKEVKRAVILNYDKHRDYPAKEGTSRLGIHFRFGTVSIREKVAQAIGLNQTFLSELIWREFYAMILDEYPQVVDRAFKPEYDKIAWRNDETEFSKWCRGKTGYPLVDAGMRELNDTGYMHNRVRMVAASFLVKHLLIDWRRGEAYFAEKLLDYELASNNGGWQWAAGCGTDAAPYFRIFNPTTQLEKFDKDRRYVNHWIPELGTNGYPEAMVDHKIARERCLKVFKEALNS
jgi:deoxyribodipyrimidine photo-lyase